MMVFCNQLHDRLNFTFNLNISFLNAILLVIFHRQIKPLLNLFQLLTNSIFYNLLDFSFCFLLLQEVHCIVWEFMNFAKVNCHTLFEVLWIVLRWGVWGNIAHVVKLCVYLVFELLRLNMLLNILYSLLSNANIQA